MYELLSITTSKKNCYKAVFVYAYTPPTIARIDIYKPVAWLGDTCIIAD